MPTANTHAHPARPRVKRSHSRGSSGGGSSFAGAGKRAQQWGFAFTSTTDASTHPGPSSVGSHTSALSHHSHARSSYSGGHSRRKSGEGGRPRLGSAGMGRSKSSTAVQQAQRDREREREQKEEEEWASASSSVNDTPANGSPTQQQAQAQAQGEPQPVLQDVAPPVPRATTPASVPPRDSAHRTPQPEHFAPAPAHAHAQAAPAAATPTPPPREEAPTPTLSNPHPETDAAAPVSPTSMPHPPPPHRKAPSLAGSVRTLRSQRSTASLSLPPPSVLRTSAAPVAQVDRFSALGDHSRRPHSIVGTSTTAPLQDHAAAATSNAAPRMQHPGRSASSVADSLAARLSGATKTGHTQSPSSSSYFSYGERAASPSTFASPGSSAVAKPAPGPPLLISTFAPTTSSSTSTSAFPAPYLMQITHNAYLTNSHAALRAFHHPQRTSLERCAGATRPFFESPAAASPAEKKALPPHHPHVRARPKSLYGVGEAPPVHLLQHQPRTPSLRGEPSAASAASSVVGRGAQKVKDVVGHPQSALSRVWSGLPGTHHAKA